VGRLLATRLGRFARASSVGIAIASIAWVVVLRLSDGAAAPVAAVPIQIAKLAFWVVAVPFALAAANARTLGDKKEGTEALLRIRGFDTTAIAVSRVVAAAWVGALGMLLPAVTAAVASAASAPSVGALGERARVLLAVAVYGLVGGGVISALGGAADLVAPRRGRWLLVTATIISWALSDVVHDPRLSVTGGLGLVLRTMVSVLGLGKIGP